MPDLSNLKLVEENIEVADDASYVDATEFGPPIPEDTYTFIQGKPEFKASAAGFLSAKMDQTIAGGEQDGRKLMFDAVSAKPFERSGVKASTMKDQLRAIGDRTTYRTSQEFADALAAGEGKPFRAAVMWEGGCNHAETPQETSWDNKADVSEGGVFRVKGARNFPEMNGIKQSEIKCPVCKQTVQARAKISRRIAAN